MDSLQNEVEKTKERNRKVELDKAWEISLTRRIFIAISTYLLISIFLIVLNEEKPFLAAIIPAIAYLISTYSAGILRSWWLNKRN